MKKRILSLFLAAVMMFSLVSVVAFAEEPVTAETAEAVVNGTDYYATLPEAVAAAQSGDTVKVLKDITITADMDNHGENGTSHFYYAFIDKSLTIDLNGKTIQYSEDFKQKSIDKDNCTRVHILFGVQGDIEVTFTGNGTLNCFDGLGDWDDSSIAIWVRSSGEGIANPVVTIENGTYYGNSQILYTTGGKFIVNGGRFENNTGLGDGNKQLFNTNGYWSFNDSKNITMYGGTVVTCDPRLFNDGSVVPEGYGVSKKAVYSEAFNRMENEYTVIPLDCRVVASVEAAPQDYDYNHYSYGHLPATVINYYTSMDDANAAAKEGESVLEVSYEHEYGENGICTVCGAAGPDHVHDYKVVGGKFATCTEDGYVEYACACGDQYTEVAEAHGHLFNGRTCILCGYKIPLWLYIKMCIEDFFENIFG